MGRAVETSPALASVSKTRPDSLIHPHYRRSSSLTLAAPHTLSVVSHARRFINERECAVVPCQALLHDRAIVGPVTPAKS